MNTRTIKSEIRSNEIINMEPSTQILHPVSAQWVNSFKLANPICLTKFQILNKETKIFNNYQCKTKPDDYKKFLYMPPIGLSSNDIVHIYNVDSIDNLYSWISENIDHTNYFSINRLVNCWICVNFSTLKNYNNFLVKIIYLMVKYVLGYQIEKISEDNPIQNVIKDYIEYWIGKHTGNEFNLNLPDEIIQMIIKKYKIKSNLN
jgi:hypothetical protein